MEETIGYDVRQRMEAFSLNNFKQKISQKLNADRYSYKSGSGDLKF